MKRQSMILLIILALVLVQTSYAQEAGEKQTVTVNSVSFNVVWCPPGTFIMGSPTNEVDRDDDETQHRVTLTKGFWMMETEVTQELYEAVMGNNPSYFKEPKCPVETVSWYSAVEFSEKLTALTGKTFTLPTEAEWEYAARAGTTTVFYYGDSLDSSMANFDGNYPYGDGAKDVNRERTIDVKSFKPNAWGLYDMHGNVWEWCLDWYGEYSGDATDPQGPAVGSGRVFRGGSWAYYGRGCRSASRYGYYPDFGISGLGFRLVRR